MNTELIIDFNDEETLFSFAQWLQNEGIDAFSKSSYNDGGAHIQTFEITDTNSSEDFEPDEAQFISIGS